MGKDGMIPSPSRRNKPPIFLPADASMSSSSAAQLPKGFALPVPGPVKPPEEYRELTADERVLLKETEETMREGRYAIMLWRPDDRRVTITRKSCKMPTDLFPSMYRQVSETLNMWKRDLDDINAKRKKADHGFSYVAE